MPNLTFLDAFSSSPIELSTVLLSLVLSFVLGAVIAWVYKKTNQGFSYDSSFAFTLLMITVIVNAIMITIGSNIALSLGLIGSLSIIRFRTAIKNSMDMAFLFWCIAVGLAVGAYQYPVALAVTAAVAVVILLFGKSTLFFKVNTDYVLTINLKTLSQGKAIEKLFGDHKLKWQVKSSFADKSGGEITYSIYGKRKLNTDELLATINNFNDVNSVSLLSPETNLFI